MTRSRYYIQCDVDDKVENWSDDAFWDEFRRRLPPEMAETPRPARRSRKHRAAAGFRRTDALWPSDAGWRRGACGAADRRQGAEPRGIDIHYMYDAILAFCDDKDAAALMNIRAAPWSRSEDRTFSWWLTNLTHRFNDDPFEQRMKEAELAYVTSEPAAAPWRRIMWACRSDLCPGRRPRPRPAAARGPSPACACG